MLSGAINDLDQNFVCPPSIQVFDQALWVTKGKVTAIAERLDSSPVLDCYDPNQTLFKHG
jgi:hypothetical protein